MNDIFVVGRFLKVLRKDLAESLRRNWFLPLIFIGIYILLWALEAWAAEAALDVSERMKHFRIIMFVFCLCTPSYLYGRINDRKNGVWYALLPASNMEKYTAMLLVCTILWPACFALLLAGIDELLTLSGGPGHGFIGHIFSALPLWSGRYTTALLCATFFAYCNILFRRHKTGKALLLYLLLAVTINKILMNPSLASVAGSAGEYLKWTAIAILWLLGYRRFGSITF